jgi:hypothetical protein
VHPIPYHFARTALSSAHSRLTRISDRLTSHFFGLHSAVVDDVDALLDAGIAALKSAASNEPLQVGACDSCSFTLLGCCEGRWDWGRCVGPALSVGACRPDFPRCVTQSTILTWCSSHTAVAYAVGSAVRTGRVTRPSPRRHEHAGAVCRGASIDQPAVRRWGSQTI